MDFFEFLQFWAFFFRMKFLDFLDFWIFCSFERFCFKANAPNQNLLPIPIQLAVLISPQILLLMSVVSSVNQGFVLNKSSAHKNVRKCRKKHVFSENAPFCRNKHFFVNLKKKNAISGHKCLPCFF